MLAYPAKGSQITSCELQVGGNSLVHASYSAMRIDSSAALGATFQRCRLARRRNGSDKDLGEVLALADAILREVDRQGKVLIDVSEGWVPQKWVSAVQGDTQRGIR